MTTGQLVFYGGLALLGLTLLTAVIFLIKKPEYKPDPVSGEPAGGEGFRPEKKSPPARTELVEPARSSGKTASVFGVQEGAALPATEKIES